MSEGDVVTTEVPVVVPEPERIKLLMVCSCGDERLRALDAKIAAGDWTVDKLIYELQWVKLGDTAYNTKIEIISDMWMRVTIELSGYNEGDDDNDDSEWYVAKIISVDCDRSLDGLLRLYTYLKEGETQVDDGHD